MDKDIVCLKDIHRSYGEVNALDGITFSVKKGEWLAVMGPSGSGKTTLLHLLALMDTPTQGEMHIDGKNTKNLSRKDITILRRETIGLIFQKFHTVPYLTAVENVMLAQYYHSMADRNDAVDVLRRVGMGHRVDHLPSMLSGGEQQRTCIARALVNYPALLLADEPTGNLDRENRDKVTDLFRELHNEGHTILMVTHDPSVGALADRRIHLDYGKIVNES